MSLSRMSYFGEGGQPEAALQGNESDSRNMLGGVLFNARPGTLTNPGQRLPAQKLGTTMRRI
jgi:hypothetical protein